MRILVTGGTGFIGRELIVRLRLNRHDVLAPTRAELNLCDVNKVSEFLSGRSPNQIYHLAGISRVNDSLGMPEYFTANTLPTITLIRAIQTLKHPTHVLFASSMHVYGNQTEVVTEATQPEPSSYYAFTKFLSEQHFAQAVAENPYLKVVITRLYSCFGPAQSEGFVAADLIRKILEIKNPNQAVLKTGPLKTFRRFVDVRDAVRVIEQLQNHEHTTNFEIYNLVSPHEMKIEGILNTLFDITQKRPKVESIADAFNAFLGLRVDGQKLFSIINPTEFRSVESTLRDMVDYAKEKERIKNAS